MATRRRSPSPDRLLTELASLQAGGERVSAELLAHRLLLPVATVRRLLLPLLARQQVLAETGGPLTFYRLPHAAPVRASTPPSPAADPVPSPSASPSPAAATPPPAVPDPAPVAPPQAAPADFSAQQLDRMVISQPLQKFLRDWQAADDAGARGDDPRRQDIAALTRVVDAERFSVIIDLDTRHRGGLARARQRLFDLLVLLELSGGDATAPAWGSVLDRVVPPMLRDASEQFVIARLRPAQVRRLVELDQPQGGDTPPPQRTVFRIWPDNVVRRQATSALPTIKADAARSSFGCTGRGIVWAVVDSGIDGSHPHFATHGNLEGLPIGVAHADFTRSGADEVPQPLVDRFGHGTHVAGIIAGALVARPGLQPQALVHERDANGRRQQRAETLEQVQGVAPECKLVSLKVLDDAGQGSVAEVMAALEAVHRANGQGQTLRIHGVNISLGYPFDPQWFACGHSPLCQVVNRLARSGVCVVVAAGNSGHGEVETSRAGTWAQGLGMSINDPGNAEHAITVGATHREAPHTYGVSFFSSKGPTGDGRAKPDLLAPGEKIISCQSGAGSPGQAAYREDSGTSMAAPHVSGAIAALLSVRREFIGRSEEVKRILLDSALDLKRDRRMQGHGLLDLFRALQSV